MSTVAYVNDILAVDSLITTSDSGGVIKEFDLTAKANRGACDGRKR